jgi:hypothetical protein
LPRVQKGAPVLGPVTTGARDRGTAASACAPLAASDCVVINTYDGCGVSGIRARQQRQIRGKPRVSTRSSGARTLVDCVVTSVDLTLCSVSLSLFLILRWSAAAPFTHTAGSAAPVLFVLCYQLSLCLCWLVFLIECTAACKFFCGRSFQAILWNLFNFSQN